MSVGSSFSFVGLVIYLGTGSAPDEPALSQYESCFGFVLYAPEKLSRRSNLLYWNSPSALSSRNLRNRVLFGYLHFVPLLLAWRARHRLYSFLHSSIRTRMICRANPRGHLGMLPGYSLYRFVLTTQLSFFKVTLAFTADNLRRGCQRGHPSGSRWPSPLVMGGDALTAQ